jgi:phenylacetate-coenzyme A ligase PaaK-like adenylate-forming protein
MRLRKPGIGRLIYLPQMRRQDRLVEVWHIHFEKRRMTTVFDPVRLMVAALDIFASSQLSPAALASRQQTRLSQLLAAAVRGSPLYRERLAGKAVATLRLRELAPVTRAELMARFDDWVTDPALRLDDLRAFVTDDNRIGQAYLGKYLVWESSGTSHQPGIFVQDAQAMAVYDALEALRRSAPRPLLRWLDPMLLTERLAFVGVTGGHFASLVSMLRLRQLNPLLGQGLRCFSILQPLHRLLAELNAFAPTVLATYPTVAAQLAELASQGQLDFAPGEVWTGGETLSQAARRRIEQGLGCVVRNSYGASEFMPIGWECQFGKMHVNADWVILEPVDAQGRATAPGQPSHSTLLTNLANHVQPLIRYDLGDQITVSSEPCGCGSTLPVIEVRGRRDEVLVMVGHDGQPVTLLPMALTTLLEEGAGVFDFQLTQQDAHTLVLRLDLHGAEAAGPSARCQAVLAKYARDQALAPIQIRVELGAIGPRGRSGKAPRVLARPWQSAQAA